MDEKEEANIEKISERLAGVKAKIPSNVKLLAVSKFHPKEAVEEAMKCGQLAFGENRVQEACEKFAEIEGAELHIIGHLQRNKVKKALEVASVIESVDSMELLEEIEKQCAKISKTVRVFFELHTGEESKTGFQSEEEIRVVLNRFVAGDFVHIVPDGFMTMAPFTEDKEKVRSSFRTLREVAERFRKEFPQYAMKELSMGMSGDYEIAIAEGSTEVRIGTAIFGERNYV